MVLTFMFSYHSNEIGFNTLRPRQIGRRFADDTFKRIFLNENARISIKISLKFVPKGPINNNPALVQIMAWRRPGDKPLSEPVMVRLLTHIGVTRPQWVKACNCHQISMLETHYFPYMTSEFDYVKATAMWRFLIGFLNSHAIYILQPFNPYFQ